MTLITKDNINGTSDPNWWKNGTVYQIYPSSFKDSNGDGVGDIPGIISKLDYLKNLGVDIIWLSPHYKSPQVDMGYDISDYTDIYEKYGTLKDCLQLIEECHLRGIKLIFDLVVNHTSDQHAWFKESRSSKTNPKRDWYIWKPAKYDANGIRQPPNNWGSFFGGSAWEWDEATEEYYLHLFAVEQPDINWRNMEARQAVYQDSIVYWLERGVDGFRIDVIELYSKPEDFPDAPILNPSNPFQNPGSIVREGPQLHEILQEMYKIGFGKYDTMTVGEGSPETYEEALKFVSAKREEINMSFQFEVTSLGKNSAYLRMDPFKLTDIKKAYNKWQPFIVKTDGWTTSFLENHDGGRSVSRFCSDSPEFRVASAKMLAVLLTTLSGTLYVYQGQEIGMINVPKEWTIEEYRDVEALNAYNVTKERSGGDPAAMKQLMHYLQMSGRDNARTPVQWDDSPNAGFTTGKPWIRVNDIYPEINVEKQLWDPYSTLSFWKTVIKFRKEFLEVTVHGEFELLDKENESVFCYTKAKGDQKIVVTLNFTEKELNYEIPSADKGKFILSNAVNHEKGKLQPFEGVIYQL